MPELALDQIDPETVDAGDGVHVPRSWIAIASGLQGIPGPVTARVVYDPTLRRAAAEWVRIDRAGDGDEVTTTLLRDVRVQAIVQASAARVIHVERDGQSVAYGAYIRGLRQETERSDGQTLREAVTLYRVGSVMNYGPLKLVSEQLGVSVSTATRMMNRARVAGLVDEATSRDLITDIRRQQLREQATHAPYRPPQGPSGPSLGL